MTDIWLISAPGESTPKETWEKLNKATTAESLSKNCKFHIPDLKVGTLDTLVALGDELVKLDSGAESLTRKIAKYLIEVIGATTKDRMVENLMIDNKTPSQYMLPFTWNAARYPARYSLRALADIIAKQIGQAEEDLKVKSVAYNTLQINLHNIERKATGSLLTRNLWDIVKKDDFILDSEFLITLVVVVPRTLSGAWFSCYEKLTDMIVPRSSRLLHDDQENVLVNVTLFRTVQDEFKLKCRENKFSVRDFVYNEAEFITGKKEIEDADIKAKKQFPHLVRWLQVHFGESFMAWAHVKGLRVFVESVLRFGLPVNFQAMVLVPNKRSQKRLREVLRQLYQHLDNFALSCKDVDVVDIPGMNMGSAEYFPYIYYRLNLDFYNLSM